MVKLSFGIDASISSKSNVQILLTIHKILMILTAPISKSFLSLTKTYFKPSKIA